MKHKDKVFQKLKRLTVEVKENLEKKGLVVPCYNKQGKLIIGHYSIEKTNSGHYNIIYNNLVLVDQINLPHTAILIANKLALGKWLDTELLALDKKYGFAFFDALSQKRLIALHEKKKDYDTVDILSNKLDISKYRYQSYKKSIATDFEKLLAVR